MNGRSPFIFLLINFPHFLVCLLNGHSPVLPPAKIHPCLTTYSSERYHLVENAPVAKIVVSLERTLAPFLSQRENAMQKTYRHSALEEPNQTRPRTNELISAFYKILPGLLQRFCHRKGWGGGGACPPCRGGHFDGIKIKKKTFPVPPMPSMMPPAKIFLRAPKKLLYRQKVAPAPQKNYIAGKKLPLRPKKLLF